MKQQNKRKAGSRAKPAPRSKAAKRRKNLPPASGCAQPPPAAPALADAAAPERARRNFRLPRKVGSLVRSIFAATDPVRVATGLLEGNHTTAGKLYLQLLEYFYGKPVQQLMAREANGEKVIFQLVSKVPRPQYPVSPAVPGSPGVVSPSFFDSRDNASDSTQEDEHD